jgi:hypothetical protein
MQYSYYFRKLYKYYGPIVQLKTIVIEETPFLVGYNIVFNFVILEEDKNLNCIIHNKSMLFLQTYQMRIPYIEKESSVTCDR